MRGTITLENGMVASFTLKDSQIAVLEHEAEQVRIIAAKEGYTIADELACGIIADGLRMLEERRRNDGEK